MIQLKCREAAGQIAFHKALIEGHHAPERHYDIADHTVVLDGYPDPVLHHDADYMLSIPGGVYQMLTPAEQDAIAESRRKAATVEETASVIEEAVDAVEDTPAAKPKRPANGG